MLRDFKLINASSGSASKKGKSMPVRLSLVKFRRISEGAKGEQVHRSPEYGYGCAKTVGG